MASSQSRSEVSGHGLTSQEVKALQEKHGLNEVKTCPVPEWKKLGKRYLDWVSIIIVSSLV